ncbi:suppressor of fused domain protein [Kibdelosporangium phytohabitans]|uniref:Uncharacterized protein n=1 Tax=Kibdelosporangium phytohabitans TaxID=860235 RepID=A0A0N9I8E1_9PSEU|nr:suppressor of fused domain protein [Kibdelosporangium phytohabitans]ALG12506.1 hypothetical protein AOZ06_41615 [Kibdelosporangium phytohabitans]MBE1464105.1 hypothetical protein [Kibdelosporangium phytohabitans]
MDQHIPVLPPLLRHVQKFAGTYVGTDSKPHGRTYCEYGLACFSSDDLVTIVSDGLRHVEADVPFGEELACTLRRSQIGHARALIRYGCDYVTETRRGLEFGQVLDNVEECFEDSGIVAVLASSHPRFVSDFNYLPTFPGAALTSENVEFQIITLIPLTRAEVGCAVQDADTLYDHWDIVRPDLFDITRPSTL